MKPVPEIVVDGPAESVTIHDDLVVTPNSPIKQLRDACKWLGISQAGSKQRMFSRIQKARDQAIKRSMVEAAQEQYKRDVPEVNPVAIPPQPSEKERSDHMLTHTPFQPWCEHCVMSRSRANQHLIHQILRKMLRENTQQFNVISWKLGRKMQLWLY